MSQCNNFHSICPWMHSRAYIVLYQQISFYFIYFILTQSLPRILWLVLVQKTFHCVQKCILVPEVSSIERFHCIEQCILVPEVSSIERCHCIQQCIVDQEVSSIERFHCIEQCILVLEVSSIEKFQCIEQCIAVPEVSSLKVLHYVGEYHMYIFTQYCFDYFSATKDQIILKTKCSVRTQLLIRRTPSSN